MAVYDENAKAVIFNIARGSLHDGDGVRSVVYLKGCSLRCLWCHNPEGLAKKKELLVYPERCIGCGRCAEICPLHTLKDGAHGFERDACSACGRCAAVCPVDALAVSGEEMTAKAVFDILLRDLHYYEASGGGVTFSGGECLLSPDFVSACAHLCRAAGIHTAVETALFVPWENVERVLPEIDLFYADLKLARDEAHQKYVGAPSHTVIQNLLYLSKNAKELRVRIPLIPSVNDGEEELSAIAAVLSSLGERLAFAEVLRYNPLAQSKYAALGKDFTAFAEDAQSEEEMKKITAFLARKSGKKVIYT